MLFNGLDNSDHYTSHKDKTISEEIIKNFLSLRRFVNDDKLYRYFNEEGIETKYIILENHIELSALAIKTLRLYNGEIVELCIDDEMITITKEK